jgi:hypothetical protein
MRKKLDLVSVSMIPWDLNRGIYGVLTEYSDGFSEKEVWGSYEDTQLMVQIRALDIIAKNEVAAKLPQAAPKQPTMRWFMLGRLARNRKAAERG